MSQKKRKTVRSIIPHDRIEQFEKSKAKAEQELKMKLSDSQFSTRKLLWALDQE